MHPVQLLFVKLGVLDVNMLLPAVIGPKLSFQSTGQMSIAM